MNSESQDNDKIEYKKFAIFCFIRLVFNITMLVQKSVQWTYQLSCLDYSNIFFRHIIKNCPSGKPLFYLT